MLDWALRTLRLCREIRDHSYKALEAFEEDNGAVRAVIKAQCIRAADALADELPPDFPASRLGALRRHAGFAHRQDYVEILQFDLPDVEANIDRYARRGQPVQRAVGFEDLLHPKVARVALGHYRSGDYRNAVLDSIVLLFDMIRERSGHEADGAKLVNEVFSPRDPFLILSELESESGRNDQQGFMEIYRGLYVGVRNPKAHSLNHDLDEAKAGQYLVMISLLVRRAVEAKVVEQPKRQKALR